MSSSRSTLDHVARHGVRTFTPRWRSSPLTTERMERLLPRHEVPAQGMLDREAWFGRTAPVVLEIGSGHGAAAVAYAAAHPKHDLLTAEVHVPGVARMLALAEPLELGNLWVQVDDAVRCSPSRPSGSLAAVHLSSRPLAPGKNPSGASCSSTRSPCSRPLEPAVSCASHRHEVSRPRPHQSSTTAALPSRGEAPSGAVRRVRGKAAAGRRVAELPSPALTTPPAMAPTDCGGTLRCSVGANARTAHTMGFLSG